MERWFTFMRQANLGLSSSPPSSSSSEPLPMLKPTIATIMDARAKNAVKYTKYRHHVLTAHKTPSAQAHTQAPSAPSVDSTLANDPLPSASQRPNDTVT